VWNEMSSITFHGVETKKDYPKVALVIQPRWLAH
jgi:hypothetical protein